MSSRPAQDIFSMNEDGSNQVNLTDSDGAVSDFSFSPDGSKIVYLEYVFANNSDDVFVMNADGSGNINQTNHPGHDFGPLWSPDGNKILFTSDRDGDNELYIMNPDGSGLRNLTNTPWPEGQNRPSWRPG